MVLGGGRGTRLYPLTKERSKPAVPFAGKYRLVDIPISNSLNSGFNRIYVLSQFNSESLNKHITRTYKLDTLSKGFVEIMAAEQSMESVDWFQGTADAVRRSLKHFNDPHIKYVLVLSGDQLYKMDFRQLLAYHIEKRAQITVACKPIEPKFISEYGILGTETYGRINKFVEKPEDGHHVKRMDIKIKGKTAYLASMGIYLFNKDTLDEILSTNKKADFGKEVLPESFSEKKAYAYIFTGYWKDIGTIKAFYEQNLIFTETVPPVDLFDEQWQFFTRPRYLPPAKIESSSLNKVMIGEGSILHICKINNSIVGLRSRIEQDAEIESSIIMGADFYESIEDMQQDKRDNIPLIGVGKNATIKKAIIDKNVRIGNDVKIINQKKTDSFESELYSIKDGIVIIPKNTIIPPGTII